MDRKTKALVGIYSSSWGISMTMMLIVSVLEIFMLIYSCIDLPLFGPYLWNYRFFYIALLAMSVVYMIVNLYARKDMESRYKALTVANPACAVFFFMWSLAITFFDALKFNTVNPTVFMTFSLTIPLSFYVYPAVYAGITLVADALLLYLTVSVSNSVAPLINTSVFLIFQFALGLSFLRLKKVLADRIAQEQENANLDVMTGFSTRRVYEECMKKLLAEPAQEELQYIAIDINGLKEVNDHLGHEAGDRLIIGAARCIEETFSNSRRFRIGGDEFVVLSPASQEELPKLFLQYEAHMDAWSDENGMRLSTSYGAVSNREYPDSPITELAKVADRRMYKAKADHYRETGRDRRQYAS